MVQGVLAVATLVLLTLVSGAKKQIYLAGTFPISGSEGWQGGQACLPAALLALEDVNSNSGLLADYHLNLANKDDQCDSGLGAYRLYEMLYQEKDQKVGQEETRRLVIVMVVVVMVMMVVTVTVVMQVMILSGCSTVCTTLAEAASQWNLVTVCYGASSPALSNRDRCNTSNTSTTNTTTSTTATTTTNISTKTISTTPTRPGSPPCSAPTPRPRCTTPPG